MSKLIDRVIEQIRTDLAYGELEAVEELLSFIPKENLVGFLPEEEWEQYEKS